MLRMRLPVGLLALALMGALVLGGCAASALGAQSTATSSATAITTPQAQATPGKADPVRKLALRVAGAWLGVEVESAEGGAKVASVIGDSPAAAAGLAVGDLITRLNDRETKDAKTLVFAMAKVKPGDLVRLEVRRGAETRQIEVTAGERPVTEIPALPKLPLLPGGGWRGLLPGLEGLEGIPAGEAFDHFLGGEYSFADKDGKPYTVRVTPGQVTAVNEESVKIRVNGAEAAEREFALGEKVAARLGAAAGRGLSVGDKVIVVTRDESNEALALLRAGPAKIRTVPEGRFRLPEVTPRTPRVQPKSERAPGA